MDKIRFLIERFGRRLLLVILVSVLLAAVLIESLWAARPLQAEKAGKQKVFQQVSDEWFQVGMEQYRRGFFKAAEQSFLEAQGYQEYLTAGKREEIRLALEKTRTAALGRKRISETIQTANDLVEQGELMLAKAHLERVKAGEFLTEEECALLSEGLKNIESQLSEQKKKLIELYNRSVELYDRGELEKAREGFLKVAKSVMSVGPDGREAEDYLVRIDTILIGRAKFARPAEARPVEKKRGAVSGAIEEELPGVESEVVQEAEPRISEGDHIEKIDRRRNIVRSYTRAVVNDAVAKVQSYISKGEFDKAKKAVERAEWTVYKNWVYLGDELFKQYNRKLKQLTEKIVEEQNRKAR